MQKEVEIRIDKSELNSKIHKYMDYPKFLSFITTGCLYFAKLEEFEDSLDSLFPEYKGYKTDRKFINIIKQECNLLAEEYLKLMVSNLNKMHKNTQLNREQIFIFFQKYLYHFMLNKIETINIELFAKTNTIIWEITDSYIKNDKINSIKILSDFLYETKVKQSLDTRLINRKRVLINCWHLGEYESDLMWKTYAKKDGILIQTSIKNLLRLNYQKYLDLNASCVIDKVKYIDLIKRNAEKDKLCFGISATQDNSDILCHYFEKYKSFADEKELRIIIAQDIRYKKQFMNKNNGENIKITVPISDFIDKIIISPFAPEYYAQTIKNTLIKMHYTKLAKKIKVSQTKEITEYLLNNYTTNI